MNISTLALAALATLTLGMVHAAPSQARMAGPAALSDADTNKDGKITCSEYKAALDQRFKKFDSNGDGGLTQEEIIAGREAMRQDRMKAMMGKIDTDNDGKLSRQEFETFSKSRHRGKTHRTATGHGHDGGKRHFSHKEHMANRFEVCD